MAERPQMGVDIIKGQAKPLDKRAHGRKNTPSRFV